MADFPLDRRPSCCSFSGCQIRVSGTRTHKSLWIYTLSWNIGCCCASQRTRLFTPLRIPMKSVSYGPRNLSFVIKPTTTCRFTTCGRRLSIGFHPHTSTTCTHEQVAWVVCLSYSWVLAMLQARYTASLYM